MGDCSPDQPLINILYRPLISGLLHARCNYKCHDHALSGATNVGPIFCFSRVNNKYANNIYFSFYICYTLTTNQLIITVFLTLCSLYSCLHYSVCRSHSYCMNTIRRCAWLTFRLYIVHTIRTLIFKTITAKCGMPLPRYVLNIACMSKTGII